MTLETFMKAFEKFIFVAKKESMKNNMSKEELIVLLKIFYYKVENQKQIVDIILSKKNVQDSKAEKSVKVKVSTHIKTLESNGLISRSHDSHDSRINLIKITKKGMNIINEMGEVDYG